MNSKKTNPCNVKDEDLTLLYVESNLDEISKDEFCMDFVIEHLIKNFEKDKKNIIVLFERICKVYSSEGLWGYSRNLFEKYPSLFLNYFNDNPQSEIRKNAIIHYNLFAEDPKIRKEIKTYFKNLEQNNSLTNLQIETLRSMYNEITFVYRGYLVDEDGYVNLRKTPNGEVLFKLDSGEEIYTLPTSEDWWKVGKNEYNFIGYVHKSRIKLLDEILDF